MNDIAREENAMIRELRHRLIRVLHGALDSVTETELPGEEKRQAAGVETIVVRAHQIDDPALVILVQPWKNIRAQSKSLLEVHLVHPIDQPTENRPAKSRIVTRVTNVLSSAI